MDQFTYFDNLDIQTRQEYTNSLKIRTFKKNETIVGKEVGFTNWVHFILSGNCVLIEDLWVDTYYDKNGNQKMKLFKPTRDNTINILKCKENKSDTKQNFQLKENILHSNKSNQNSMNRRNKVTIEERCSKVNLYFIQLCTYSEKACFCIGESFERRRIIAKTDVKCLLLPRYLILKSSQVTLWRRIQRHLQLQIPNSERLFREFVKKRKWRSYKYKLFNNLIHKAPCNNIHNIPYSIRIRNDISKPD